MFYVYLCLKMISVLLSYFLVFWLQVEQNKTKC